MNTTKSSKKIIIFASGTGTNARAILQYFKNSPRVQITHILSNNPGAGVLEIAKEHGVATRTFNRKEFYQSGDILRFLQTAGPDFIILAGFLWIIPKDIITAFPDKIINIHPSLLPRYGGKGMYGDHVHRSVLRNGEKETGISIHYVNPHYDEGQIIAQFKIPLDAKDDLTAVKEKIHRLEHTHYPQVIHTLLFPDT